MKAQYFDLQDATHPLNEASFETDAEVRLLLESLRDRQPFIAQLTGANGYTLTLGLGGPKGCAQFSPSNGDTPYSIAVGDATRTAREGEFEFMCGGTPTPIAERFLLPILVVEEIAAEFLRTGGRYPQVEWEEI